MPLTARERRRCGLIIDCTLAMVIWCPCSSSLRLPEMIPTSASGQSQCIFSRAWESSSSRCARISAGSLNRFSKEAKISVLPVPVGKTTRARRAGSVQASSTRAMASS